MSALSIDGSIRLDHGAPPMTFRLDVEAGQHVALVGPNGAGKSSLARTIAGHERLISGTIRLADADLDQPDTGTFVPPERRNVGYLPQRGALFAHMTVLDNVAFAARAGGMGRRAARADARQRLEAFGIGHLADRRPATLSGGQAARVALARTLVADPAVVVLDEPAAALDAPARAWLRSTLDGLAQTLVVVTHDPLDALVGADSIAVLADGEVVQAGTAAAISSRPANNWVADFLGLNVVTGTADGTTVALPTGAFVALAEAHEGLVHVSFPANAVTLDRNRPTGSARNAWEVSIVGLHAEDDADRVRVVFDGPMRAAALVTTGAVEALDLRPGLVCWASVKATELRVIPA